MSLTLRLSLLTIAAALVTLAGLVFAVREMGEESLRFSWERHLIAQVRHWGTLIGTAEEPEEFVEELAEHFDLDIRVAFHDGWEYTTDDDLPAAHEFDDSAPIRRRYTRRFPPGMSLHEVDHHLYLVHDTPDARLIYRRYGGHHHDWDDQANLILWAFGFLATLFGSLMFITRRWLRPLREVSDAMESYAREGEPAPPAPPWWQWRRPDEVSRVRASFMSMRDRVDGLLDSRDRLLRDVSHEIRSPLARLRLRLEFIDDAGQRAKMAADINEIDTLSGELLDRAYLVQDGRLPAAADLDLGQLVRDAIAGLADAASHVRTELPSAPAIVRGDARLLRRLLSNLINNSLKHSTLGPGSITVRVGQADGKVTLVVADAGERLPAAVVTRLFEPFYRPDTSRTRASGGHGLGLALVAAIAAAHGGTATAASPAAGGLAVTVKLPAA